MKTTEHGIESSKDVENVYHMRLMALLKELVRDKGYKGAARVLELDQRTVAESARTGQLSRRVRQALERALQEGVGSAAARQRERNDRLEKRVEALEKGRDEMAKGYDALGKELRRRMAAVEGRVEAPKSRRPEHGRHCTHGRGVGCVGSLKIVCCFKSIWLRFCVDAPVAGNILLSPYVYTLRDHPPQGIERGKLRTRRTERNVTRRDENRQEPPNDCARPGNWSSRLLKKGSCWLDLADRVSSSHVLVRPK